MNRSLHCKISTRPMSAPGHNRTKRHLGALPALPPKADIERHDWHVRFVPKADICSAAKSTLIDQLVGGHE